MIQTTDIEITIVGAGLTGLATAHFLKKAGRKVRILERSEKPGGVISTITKDGFVFETGPNTGLTSNKEVLELLDDMQELCQVEYARAESKKRLIWKNNRWHALPSGPVSGILTPLFSPADKFGILMEPFRKKGNDTMESVAGMVKRRLGRSYLDYAVDPFISGVYAGDPEYLVTRFALPKLYALEQEYGSFIRGAIQKARERKKDVPKVRSRIFSFQGGMDMLIRALTKSVGDENLFTDCRDAAIIPSESNFLVSAQINGRPCEWKSEKIILCTGSRGLDKLLPFISPGDMKGLSSLEYAKVIQVAAGFSLWKGMQLNAYGGLIPYREKSRILGILFPSSIFTRRAPTGGALLSVFLGGFRNPGMLNLTDSEIEEIVLAEIETMLQLKDPKPDLLSIHRYTAAIPQYGRTSETRIGEIKRIEKRFPGLVLASNIRDGIGMADRIRQAKTIADQLAEK